MADRIICGNCGGKVPIPAEHTKAKIRCGHCGYYAEVPEAMRAAYILKRDFDCETRVINLHTLKPLDRAAIIRAAKETGVVITAEEHQIGALSGRVSEVITGSGQLYGLPVITGAIGVKDRFGDSGAPWELIKEFEVSAEHIAQKAVELLAIKKSQAREHAMAAL